MNDEYNQRKKELKLQLNEIERQEYEIKVGKMKVDNVYFALNALESQRMSILDEINIEEFIKKEKDGGRKEVARKLLKTPTSLSIKEISYVTGLTEEEIEKLREEN